jgi:hypothetical protein
MGKKKPTTLAQASKLLELLGQSGLGSDDFQELLRSGFISDLFEARGLWHLSRDGVREALGMLPRHPFILVDYGDRSYHTILQTGGYAEIDPRLNPYPFPQGKEEDWDDQQGFECQLVEENFSFEAARKKIAELPTNYKLWKPASFEHLLVFGATFPRLSAMQVIALGSRTKDGLAMSPYIGRVGNDRRLGLIEVGNFKTKSSIIGGTGMFLAVRPFNRDYAKAIRE